MTPHLMGLILLLLGLVCSVGSVLRLREVLRLRRAQVGDWVQLRPEGAAFWTPDDYELARQAENTSLQGRPVVWMTIAKLAFGIVAGLVLAAAGGAIWWATRGA